MVSLGCVPAIKSLVHHIHSQPITHIVVFLGISSLAIGGVDISGLGIVDDVRFQHGDLRHAVFCRLYFCCQFLRPNACGIRVVGQRIEIGKVMCSLSVWVHIIDDHTAGGVFLLLCSFQEVLPAVHDNVHGMDPCAVEQSVLEAHGAPPFLRCGSPLPHDQKGKQQGQHHGDQADAVHVFARAHGAYPMYSPL